MSPTTTQTRVEHASKSVAESRAVAGTVDVVVLGVVVDVVASVVGIFDGVVCDGVDCDCWIMYFSTCFVASVPTLRSFVVK